MENSSAVCVVAEGKAVIFTAVFKAFVSLNNLFLCFCGSAATEKWPLVIHTFGFRGLVVSVTRFPRT